jgi:predicted dehydrogenase
VGARGHGWWHLENLRRLEGTGVARLVGVVDRRPGAVDLDGFTDVEIGTDLDEVLTRTRPHVTVICTPIHTHADLSVTAMEAGSHVLLEKPPAPTYEEYRRISRVAERTGRACQIGFQDLGSLALPAIRRLIEDGAVGEVIGIGAAGAWVRPRSYFTRSPWAGRREVDGVPVVDGALTNPFAHATASALWLAGVERRDEIADVEVELFRANEIESDDTSCLRIRPVTGPAIVVAATLCAAEDQEPTIVVHGTAGRIALRYKSGEVSCEGRDGTHEATYPRVDLLENLVAHLADGSRLLAPIAQVDAFMAVVDGPGATTPAGGRGRRTRAPGRPGRRDGRARRRGVTAALLRARRGLGAAPPSARAGPPRRRGPLGGDVPRR